MLGIANEIGDAGFGAFCAAIGGLLVVVGNEIRKWYKDRSAAKAKATRDAYDRQAEREATIDKREDEFSDRMTRLLDEQNEELSRRLVAERYLRDELTRWQVIATYQYAIMEGYYNQLVGAKVMPAGPLPEKPAAPTADQKHDDLEFLARSRKHTVDLISSQALQVQADIKKKRDSDSNGEKSGGNSNTAPGKQPK